VARFNANPLSGAGSTWNTFSAGVEFQIIYQPVVSVPVIRDTITVRDTTTRLVRGIKNIQITPLSATMLDSSVSHTPESEMHIYRMRRSYLRSVPKPAPLLSGNIAVRFISKTGGESMEAKVNVEQTLRRTSVPLLPYVFFGRGSSEPFERYEITVQTPKLIPERSIYDGDALVLPVYRSILPILARRLQEKPATELILTGSVSADEEREFGQILAAARAEKIKQYWQHRRRIVLHRNQHSRKVLRTKTAASKFHPPTRKFLIR
jgi:hypothetical protein